MFRAIGTVIVIYALSSMLHNAFVSFENAVVATFDTITVAAKATEAQIDSMHQ